MRRKILSLTLSLSLFFQYPGFAQTLNLANYLSQNNNPLVSTDSFRPIQLKYFSYEPETSDFKILLDKGDQKNLSDIQVKDEANKLLTYFKIGLTLPNEKFWVNLRPDAQDQIIDPELEKTDIGKILLAADLQLKKDTASWTSPQTKEGKEYWDKMYKRAEELLGSENVTIPTITRPWIVPGEIILKASDSSAYIYKANLKVMLEEDYLKSTTDPITQTNYSFSDPRLKELNQYSTQLIRELIVPKLTKRINSSKDYVNLRQVYFSLILARWFKETFSNHQPPVSGRQSQDNSYINLIDSHNLSNLTSKQAWDKTDYFQDYQKSFKQGEYHLSEPVYTPTGQVIRRYMSGGISIMGVSGSPLEWGRFRGNLKEFYWFVKLMSKTMIALFVRGNGGDAAKAMEEFNANFVSDLSPADQNILNAGLTNIFDGSINIEIVEDVINSIYEVMEDDSPWIFTDGVGKFNEQFGKSPNKEEYLKEKTKLALENKLSEDVINYLPQIWSGYYKRLGKDIDSRLQETNYSAQYFSVIQRLLESPKFKDTSLGRKYASAQNKRSFIRNIISLNVVNEETKTEELSILSHVWREISGKTSHPGYITSEEAGKISAEYNEEIRKYGNLIRDFIAQNSYYFNEYTISQTEDLLKNGRTKEAASRAFRAINNLHYTYTLRYGTWIKTYNFYSSRRIRFSEYLNELGKLSDEIKESLSDLPLFPKESNILSRKKGQNAWEAAKENLNTVDEALRILENKKTIFELLKELPDAMTYLYARAVTKKEQAQLNKLKEEIGYFINKSLGFSWFDMNEVKEYLNKGEARHIMLATIKIALIYAKEAGGVESREVRKWKNKAQELVKQFSASSSSLAEQREELKKKFAEYQDAGWFSSANKQIAKDLAKAEIAIVEYLYKGDSYSLTATANQLSSIAQANHNGKDYWYLIEIAEKIRKAGVDERSSSSLALASTAPTKTGGIDLRQMNMLIQPQGAFSGLDLTLPALSSSAIEAMDLDKELANIQRMVSSGLIPSGQRLKEFLAVCFAKGKIEEKADSLILCIADTFELQQMEAEESSLIYKEALVIADTRRYVLKKV